MSNEYEKDDTDYVNSEYEYEEFSNEEMESILESWKDSKEEE